MIFSKKEKRLSEVRQIDFEKEKEVQTLTHEKNPQAGLVVR